jgi:hypothetical protein
MGRLRWTDQRIDERMTAMDEKFERQFDELRALREEMRAGFAELRADLSAFQRQVTFIVGGFAVGLLGLLGAWLALAVD